MRREVMASCLHPASHMPTKIGRADGIDPISSLGEGVRATIRLMADSGQERLRVLGRAADGRVTHELLASQAAGELFWRSHASTTRSGQSFRVGVPAV